MIVKHLVILEIDDLKEAGDTVYPMGKRVFGRVLAADLKDPVTGELILSRGDIVTREMMVKLDGSAVSKDPCSFSSFMSGKTWCLCTMLWL